MLEKHVEDILLVSRADSLNRAQELLDRGSDLLKHPIAEILAIELVDKVEAVYVEYNGIEASISIVLLEPGCILKEELPGIEVCEEVLFGPFDYHPAF